jgi:hypothetical protein
MINPVIFLIIIIVLSFNGFCESKPQKLSSCSAKLDDGKIIDLKLVDNPNNPRLIKPLLYSFSNFLYILYI